MALLPKVRIKWREPKALVMQRDSRVRTTVIWWQQAVGVVIITIIMMLVWYLATLNPKKSPPSFEIALILAISLGVFLVYIVPWIVRLCPSEIKLTDDAVIVTQGNRHRWAKWKDIGSCILGERDGFQVIRLHLRKGHVLELGLDSTVDLPEIQRFLQGVGVSIDASEQDVHGNTH
jgi:hypothetical protein